MANLEIAMKSCIYATRPLKGTASIVSVCHLLTQWWKIFRTHSGQPLFSSHLPYEMSRTFFSFNNNLGRSFRSFRSRSFLVNLSWLGLVKWRYHSSALVAAKGPFHYVQPALKLILSSLCLFYVIIYKCLAFCIVRTWMLFSVCMCKNKEGAVEHSIIFHSFNIFINTVYTMSQRLSLNINTLLRDIDTCNLDIWHDIDISLHLTVI